MKVTITPTAAVGTINGNPCMVWDGTTTDGIKLHVFVAAIGSVSEEHRDLLARRLAMAGFEEAPFAATIEIPFDLPEGGNP